VIEERFKGQSMSVAILNNNGPGGHSPLIVIIVIPAVNYRKYVAEVFTLHFFTKLMVASINSLYHDPPIL
jgi:hypothetical protein